MSILNRYVEQNFRDRLKALNRQPRIPVPVMARGFVGAHLVILEAWLAGELQGDIEELASMALDLFVAGGGEFASTSSDTQPDPRPMPTHHRQTEMPVPGAWPGLVNLTPSIGSMVYGET